MEKKTIGIIFGGCNSEYSVSLESAYGVISNLDKAKYEVISIGITRDGRWFRYMGDIDQIIKDKWHEDIENLVPAIISPDRRVGGLWSLRMGAIDL